MPPVPLTYLTPPGHSQIPITGNDILTSPDIVTRGQVVGEDISARQIQINLETNEDNLLTRILGETCV